MNNDYNPEDSCDFVSLDESAAEHIRRAIKCLELMDDGTDVRMHMIEPLRRVLLEIDSAFGIDS